ncbi:hypothetical protein Tco_1275778 [Tanacetum coccineum]
MKQPPPLSDALIEEGSNEVGELNWVGCSGLSGSEENSSVIHNLLQSIQIKQEEKNPEGVDQNPSTDSRRRIGTSDALIEEGSNEVGELNWVGCSGLSGSEEIRVLKKQNDDLTEKMEEERVAAKAQREADLLEWKETLDRFESFAQNYSP